MPDTAPDDAYQKIDRLAPEILWAFRQAPVFEEFGMVQARPAQAGERIETVLADGRKETEHIALDGDMVVTASGGEQYIVPQDRFSERYQPTSEAGTYEAFGYVRAVKNIFKRPIEIVAPWGSPQRGDASCWIADPCDVTGKEVRDPYLIDAAAFERSYRFREAARE